MTKTINIYQLSYYGAILGLFCIWVGLPFEFNFLVSTGVKGIFVTELLSFIILCFSEGLEKRFYRKFLFASLLFFYGLMVCIFTSGFSVQNISKLILFYQIPIYFIISDYCNIDNLKKDIYKLNCIYIVFCCYIYFLPIAHRYYGDYGIIMHPDLTLGYHNPNEAAIYLMINFIIALASFFYYKNKIIKIFEILNCCVLFYFIKETQCRAGILICLLLCLVFVFKTFYISSSLIKIIVILPFFFLIFGLVPSVLQNINILGDNILTGRGDIYFSVVKNLNLWGIIWGDFSQYHFENLHNAYLSIIATIGFVGLLIFIIFLYLFLKEFRGRIQNKENLVLILGMFLLIIYSSVEAALWVSGGAYAASIFVIYSLGRSGFVNKS